MPTFLITGPDGAQYRVTAPDGASEQDVMAHVQQQAAQSSPPSSSQAEAAVEPTKAEDKYTAAARADIARERAASLPSQGLGRLAAQGMTLNSADEILAGLMTPFEMVSRRTFSPIEGYNYAKAYQDAKLDEARKNSGYAGTAAEVVGGIGSGAGLARAGFTAAKLLPKGAGLLKRAGAAALDGLGMGATAGFMEGNTADERTKNAAIGGVLGGSVGLAAPIAGQVAKGVLSPLVSNAKARINPTGYAETQVARALDESGMTPQIIAGKVSQAAADGQPMYTLADAMGNPGQRMLSTVARSPGNGRTAVVDFLEQRQAGQGRRIANTLSEGFDSPQTVAQTRTAMTNARDKAADIAYGAARNNAKPVDVSNVINRIDETLQPGVNKLASPQSGIANDGIEAALATARSKLTDGRSVQTDYVSLERLRKELADEAQVAMQSGRGNKARMLGSVIRELDTALENASTGFRDANRQFAKASRNIDAIDQGRAASLRGRSEDTIPAFRALPALGQDAYRTGYVDPLIEQAQGAAMGANKARPLTSDAFRDELAAIAPMRTQTQMTRRLDRENTMFETRAQALGGSKTADNLSDADAMSIDPSIIGHLISGNITGAAKSMLASGSNLLTGNTPQVRNEVARLLLQSGKNFNPRALQKVLDTAMARLENAKKAAILLGRGAQGGLAVGATETRR